MKGIIFRYLLGNFWKYLSGLYSFLPTHFALFFSIRTQTIRFLEAVILSQTLRTEVSYVRYLRNKNSDVC